MNPYKDKEDESFSSPPRLSYEDIATKLLKDHYFLTALELHTELVESGKELPQLREFFSNPGNFEQHVSRASEFGSIHRTPSQATLDSLDTARYSEDGGGDRGGSGNDVAVLEFELRKARETINALRANLTQCADGEVLDKKSQKFDHRSLKSHEKRALNFLINEYLLLQDYKLTSITFSDENPDQDFEDWDDVGLNMPRPSGLVSLFWGNSTGISAPKKDISTQMDTQISDMSIQTDFEESNVCVSCQTSQDNETLEHELLIQAEEIELLKQKVIDLETEKMNFQKLYDAAIVSLNSLTSPATESKEFHIPEERMLHAKCSQTLDIQPLTCTASENHYGSGNSTHSATPEQFEMIESEKNSANIRKDGSNTSSFEPALTENSQSVRHSTRRSSVTTLDETETLSINEGTGEWTRVHYGYGTIESCTKEMWVDSGLPNSLKLSILNWCCESLNLTEPLSNDLLAELVNSDKPITLPGLLTLVADTMPRVLAHTLVARRSEAAALLCAASALLPAGDARRSRTLHALLTLNKRPDAADTRAICEAACLIVKWGGGGEVLSSVAELLTSRSTERRVLASQICVSIGPYVSVELCSSLLLSVVTVMCDSAEQEVRSLGIRAACLICPVAEHKYDHLRTLMFNMLKDSSEKNVADTVKVYVPLLARVALIAGKFTSDLFSHVISNYMKAISENEWKNVIIYLDVLRSLVVATVVHVINVQIVKNIAPNETDVQINLHEVPLQTEQEHFVDIQCYMTDNIDAKVLIVSMNSIFKKNPDVRWEELTWFINMMKTILETTLNSKILNHTTAYESVISLISSYIDNFGLNFTINVVRPIFLEAISELEVRLEKLDTVSVENTVIVGLYLVTVLHIVEDRTGQLEFLQKWVAYSALRSVGARALAAPLAALLRTPSTAPLLHHYLQHLAHFVEMKSESGSAIRAYVGRLIAELVDTTELDEICIEKLLLPTVVSLMRDHDSGVREAGITAWGVVTRELVSREAGGASACWTAADELLPRTQHARELARAAEALALLLVPAPHATEHSVPEKAVSLVCALCEAGAISGSLSAESVAALVPAIQLAAHHARDHPALLPALRKLEECVQSPALSQYKGTVESLCRDSTVPTTGGGSLPHSGGDARHAAQEVGRRVTQMFQNSKTNINIQNIFKKKS